MHGTARCGHQGRVAPSRRVDHGLEVGVTFRRHDQRTVPEVRRPPHADVAVAPRLFGDPIKRFDAVFFLEDERDERSLRGELTTNVLHNHRIARFGKRLGDPPHTILAVGRAHEHGRKLRSNLGQVDIDRQVHAVGHADLEIASLGK